MSCDAMFDILSPGCVIFSHVMRHCAISCHIIRYRVIFSYAGEEHQFAEKFRLLVERVQMDGNCFLARAHMR